MTATLTKPKPIDINKALELRVKKGMTYKDIGTYFDCTKQAVQQALKKFTALILEPGELAAYRGVKGEILESVEAHLLNDLVDTDKRQKASLNNTAYALNTVANMTRLENNLSTSNISYRDMSKSLEELTRERQQLQESMENA